MSTTPSKSTNDEFISSTIGVHIASFNEKYVDRKTVTFYTIEVVNHYSKTN